MNDAERRGLANGAARNARRNIAPRSVHLTDTQFALIEMLRYGRILVERWWLILGVTILVGGVVGIRDKFFSVKWYRAQAVITPVTAQESLASSIGIGSPTSATAADELSLLDLGGAGGNVGIAEQYIAILNSYAFTTDLIKHYNLSQKIMPVQNGRVPHISPWKLHETITGRFETVYDYKSGNLNLYFMDPDPEFAKNVLGYYLTSLRDKVRNAEVQSATLAVASLEAEIGKTPDALLQSQLYELAARQIQREKLAQVEADFAYKVIEPPVVPDQYYAPRARRDAELAAAIVFVLLTLAMLTWEFVKRTRQEYLLEFAPAEPSPGPAVDLPSPEPARAVLSRRGGLPPPRD